MKNRLTLIINRCLPILLLAAGLQNAAAQQSTTPAGPSQAEPFADFTLVRSKNVAPSYPRRAVQQGREGWVDLAVTVKPDGSVGDVAVVDSMPKRIFERPAIRAAKQWEFDPPSASGINVSLTRKYRVRFRLVE